MSDLKLARKLICALGISVSLNLLFLGGAVYSWSKGHTSQMNFSYKPFAQPGVNAAHICKLRQDTFPQLVEQLEKPHRDLALAALVAFHDFDLSRAIGSDCKLLQQRSIPYGINQKGKQLSITTYPGLTKSHYQHVRHFISTERWPFTAKGLFRRIKEKADPSLIEAFTHTPHFVAVNRLFLRAAAQPSPNELIQLITQGEWALLADFVKAQRQSQDLSPEKRQQLLFQYVQAGSCLAAELLVQTDGPAILKTFDDQKLLLIVSKTHSRDFIQSILTTPHSEMLWKEASKQLYVGEEPPRQVHHAALNKLATVKTYQVQEGDSLWKIAKRFNLSIEKLIESNDLETDVLRPGMNLKLK